jgi:hypothetical protein
MLLKWLNVDFDFSHILNDQLFTCLHAHNALLARDTACGLNADC